MHYVIAFPLAYISCVSKTQWNPFKFFGILHIFMYSLQPAKNWKNRMDYWTWNSLCHFNVTLHKPGIVDNFLRTTSLIIVSTITLKTCHPCFSYFLKYNFQHFLFIVNTVILLKRKRKQVHQKDMFHQIIVKRKFYIQIDDKIMNTGDIPLRERFRCTCATLVMTTDYHL